MKKVLRANTYFLIIILLQLFLPIHLMFKWFNITDTKIIIKINLLMDMINLHKQSKSIIELNKQ